MYKMLLTYNISNLQCVSLDITPFVSQGTSILLWTFTTRKSLTSRYPFYLLQNTLLPTSRLLRLPICKSPLFHSPPTKLYVSLSVLVFFPLVSKEEAFKVSPSTCAFWSYPVAIFLDFIHQVGPFFLCFWPFLLYVILLTCLILYQP